MRWLALDGALGAFSAAVVSRAPGEPARYAASAGNDALERGLAIVEEVLAGTSLAALEGIAVGTGPGAFTGLRIALSYAKSLAFAARRPLVGISSYDALEPQATPQAPHATFVRGRAGAGCVRMRGAGDELIRCGSFETLAEALAARLAAGSRLLCFGAAEGVAPALGERGIIVRACAPGPEPPAVVIARRAMDMGAPAGDAHAIRADYGEAHYGERGGLPGEPRAAT